MGRSRRLLFSLLVVSLSTALALVLAEGMTRLVAPQQLITLRPDIWVPDDGLGWVHAANVDTRVNTGEKEVRFRTDARGRRIGARPPRAPRYRLLVLGDSFLEALQVEYEESIPGLVETELSRHLGRSVKVDNTAVGGWNPNQYLLQLDRSLADTSYDLVLVFLYAGNDALTFRQDHVPPRRPARRHRFHLVPERWTWKALVEAYLRPVNDVLEGRSHLFNLLKDRAWFLLMRLGLSARYFPRHLLQGDAEDRWDLTAAACRDMAARAWASGTEAWFILLPALYQVDERMGRRFARGAGYDPDQIDLDRPSRLLIPRLKGAGLRVFDALPWLRQALREGRGPLYGRVDYHFAPEGHAQVARRLLPFLEEALCPGGSCE